MSRPLVGPFFVEWTLPSSLHINTCIVMGRCIANWLTVWAAFLHVSGKDWTVRPTFYSVENTMYGLLSSPRGVVSPRLNKSKIISIHFMDQIFSNAKHIYFPSVLLVLWKEYIIFWYVFPSNTVKRCLNEVEVRTSCVFAFFIITGTENTSVMV